MKLVGRARDMARVREGLARTRLVTLTGVGGVGKTRLAQAASAQVSRAYPGGVWFVDLGDISDPNLLAGVVARTLEVYPARGQPVEAHICERLGGNPALVVLDNCEHLVD